jgi:hypothetical protein
MGLPRIILSIVVALLLLFTGGGKVLSLPYSAAGRKQLGLSIGFWRLTGALELAAVVGLVGGIWFVPLGIAAAAGVVLLMIGAIAFRVRASDDKARRGVYADILLLIIAGAIIVLSLLDVHLL